MRERRRAAASDAPLPRALAPGLTAVCPRLQACLSPGAPDGARATLLVQVGDNETALAVCALRGGGTECVGLDLIFDSYAEFSVEGSAGVHLTGYYMPEYEIGE